MKRILASVLGLAVFSALASGYAPIGESGSGQSGPAISTGSDASYTTAADSFGAGVYPPDTDAAYEQNATGAPDMTLNVTSNEFTTDKSIAQPQNQLASAPDGVAPLGISETLFPVAAQYCKNTETPYVFLTYAPKDEDVVTFEQDEYYVGMVAYSPQGEGVGTAELILAGGCRAAVVSTGASGDHARDRRIISLTETFEAGGGGVLFVSHLADPSEGV